jgi:hypothetical protein
MDNSAERLSTEHPARCGRTSSTARAPMSSQRQIEANRRNARMSTGPRTEEGKRRSRRNAFRHGLTAETVIEILEDIDDYQAFEAAIIADYDAHTAVERELTLRLASLLWRIRRATAIETELLRIQTEILHDRRNASEPVARPERASHNGVYRFIKSAISSGHRKYSPNGSDNDHGPFAGDPADDLYDERDASSETSVTPSRGLTHCFMRLANLDSGAFDRLGRYEAALWRQIVQTLFALQPLRRRQDRLG